MFKTLSEQIAILQSRGVIVDDNSSNQRLLLDNNYYNVINGFKDPFLISASPDLYKSGTKFEEIFALYDFDRKLRSLLLEYFLIIENDCKTKIAYDFSSRYNENDYLNIDNYNSIATPEEKIRISRFLGELGKKLDRGKTNGIYVHFINANPPKTIPLWAAVNFFDFGDIRELYSFLDDTVRFNIANYYSISQNNLDTMLSCINMFRNVCAHDNRVMKYIIYKKNMNISNMPIHTNLKLKKDTVGNYLFGKKDLFSVFICFKYLG